jgi:aldose 1-epimerase
VQSRSPRPREAGATLIARSGRQFELVHGDQAAVVVEVGGGLRTYIAASRELLDGYAADELCPSGRGQVLLPWPNRLEDGAYEFDGHRHQLPLNELEARNAIHGLVRWQTWTGHEQGPSRCVLEHLLHPQPGYPFSLSVRLEYTLSDDGLSVKTTATNVGSEPCPYGCGAHPYLTLGTETVDSLLLRAPARTVLDSDDRGLPTGRSAVAGTEYDFAHSRGIGATRLDNCFTDLEREKGLACVALESPDGSGLTVWMDESYGYVMLFTGDPLPDVDRRSIAVEPMTCPPNAFRTGESLIRLEPGHSFTSRWGIAPASGFIPPG